MHETVLSFLFSNSDNLFCFVETIFFLISDYFRILVDFFLKKSWNGFLSEYRISAPAPGEDPLGEDSASSTDTDSIDSSNASENPNPDSSNDEDADSEADPNPENPAEAVPPYRAQNADRENALYERIIRLEEGEAYLPLPQFHRGEYLQEVKSNFDLASSRGEESYLQELEDAAKRLDFHEREVQVQDLLFGIFTRDAPEVQARVNEASPV